MTRKHHYFLGFIAAIVLLISLACQPTYEVRTAASVPDQGVAPTSLETASPAQSRRLGAPTSAVLAADGTMDEPVVYFGVYSQPKEDAAKWAAEGITLAIHSELRLVNGVPTVNQREWRTAYRNAKIRYIDTYMDDADFDDPWLLGFIVKGADEFNRRFANGNIGESEINSYVTEAKRLATINAAKGAGKMIFINADGPHTTIALWQTPPYNGEKNKEKTVMPHSTARSVSWYPVMLTTPGEESRRPMYLPAQAVYRQLSWSNKWQAQPAIYAAFVEAAKKFNAPLGVTGAQMEEQVAYLMAEKEFDWPTSDKPPKVAKVKLPAPCRIVCFWTQNGQDGPGWRWDVRNDDQKAAMQRIIQKYAPRPPPDPEPEPTPTTQPSHSEMLAHIDARFDRIEKLIVTKPVGAPTIVPVYNNCTKNRESANNDPRLLQMTWMHGGIWHPNTTMDKAEDWQLRQAGAIAAQTGFPVNFDHEKFPLSKADVSMISEHVKRLRQGAYNTGAAWGVTNIKVGVFNACYVGNPATQQEFADGKPETKAKVIAAVKEASELFAGTTNIVDDTGKLVTTVPTVDYVTTSFYLTQGFEARDIASSANAVRWITEATGKPFYAYVEGRAYLPNNAGSGNVVSFETAQKHIKAMMDAGLKGVIIFGDHEDAKENYLKAVEAK